MLRPHTVLSPWCYPFDKFLLCSRFHLIFSSFTSCLNIEVLLYCF
uniref:Uncharacterized protein n=1 Tax=uncultured marine Nitrospinaceae bacterium TaxID=482920 RepID=A4GJ48_9BACT|nr:hypothetical protein [uncultured marine Nitrospinaceae bacterium]